MSYPVLDPVSRAYPRVRGRMLTCYSPVRRSSTPKGLSARLACVKHAASVRPEPGSNSPLNVEIKTQQTEQSGKTPWRGGLNPPCPSCLKEILMTRINTTRTEVLAIHLALTFSTLLSSQETDSHRRPLFRVSFGATLLSYQPLRA